MVYPWGPNYYSYGGFWVWGYIFGSYVDCDGVFQEGSVQDAQDEGWDYMEYDADTDDWYFAWSFYGNDLQTAPCTNYAAWTDVTVFSDSYFDTVDQDFGHLQIQ